MKKSTIYILVNSLFLQMLVGCYSSKNITLNELKNYSENNTVIVTTTDNKEYTLNRDSTSTKNYSDWKYFDNRIDWVETKLVFEKDNPREGKYINTNGTIEENEVSKIAIEEFDFKKTLQLSLGILLVAVLVYGLFIYEPDYLKGFKW